MKILYVENMILGHHVPYVTALSGMKEYESIIITPVYIPGINKNKQIIFRKMDFETKKVSDYMACLSFIDKIAAEKHVDIIHFLDGDKIMRYFGVGMKKLSDKYQVIITYHHFFCGAVRMISYKCMAANRTVVVHTDRFVSLLRKYKVKNIEHIEYPGFLPCSEVRTQNDIPVIGMFGDTRYDKGLDLLLRALNNVKVPFKLIVAGKENDYSREEIEKLAEAYIDNVVIDLKFLSDEELGRYWDMTDVVVLPYRSIFDGASGQLTEGVRRKLPIIGPDHGSLKRIIQENHIGILYKTEDIDDMAAAIEDVLKNGFVYDNVALEYAEYLSPERFCREYFSLYQKVL